MNISTGATRSSRWDIAAMAILAFSATACGVDAGDPSEFADEGAGGVADERTGEAAEAVLSLQSHYDHEEDTIHVSGLKNGVSRKVFVDFGARIQPGVWASHNVTVTLRRWSTDVTLGGNPVLFVGEGGMTRQHFICTAWQADPEGGQSKTCALPASEAYTLRSGYVDLTFRNNSSTARQAQAVIRRSGGRVVPGLTAFIRNSW